MRLTLQAPDYWTPYHPVGSPCRVSFPEAVPSTSRGRWQRYAGRRRFSSNLEIRASGPGSATKPLLWHGLLRFPANRLHKAMLEAVTVGRFTFEPAENAPVPRGNLLRIRSTGMRDQLTGTIGFRLAPSEVEVANLHLNRSLLIKLQYVLWARAISETEAPPVTPISVSVSQLCEDLGFARLRNGAHRPEHKRQVRAAFELLTSLRVEVDYQAPDGRVTRLTGCYWARHPELETDRTVAFSPGDWQSDPIWARYNGSFGLAPSGLLSLRADRDRWSIALGGYLAVVSRMNGYRPLVLRTATLLERSGLATAESRNPGRMRDKLERSLDRLQAAGVIGGWDWSGTADYEPGMDIHEDLVGLVTSADQASRSVVIQWPAALQKRCQDLRAAREKYWRERRQGNHSDRR